jgi:hypothetical protein
MHCDEGKKFINLVQVAEKELNELRLPPAIEPLGIETPKTGNFFGPKEREAKHKAQEKVDNANVMYQNHISNCMICSNESRQRKT